MPRRLLPATDSARPENIVAPYWGRARRALARRDRVLGGIIRSYAGEMLEPRGDAFGTLARSIVGQQISVKAAASVWRRLEERLDGAPPEAVASARADKLRRCGLSQAKARYCKCLARAFLDGSIAPASWDGHDDETVIAELTRVPGIGRWTAEMFLIFYLQRPDVLPLDDIGLQRAVARHYGAGERFGRAALIALAEPWRPWRSVATWYLWRSLDPTPVLY